VTAEKTTLERKLLYQNMQKNTLMPDVLLKELNNQKITLKTIAKKRNLILFWSSECPHCVSILPAIIRELQQFDPANLNIIAFSLDSDLNLWQKKCLEFEMEKVFSVCDGKGWDGDAAKQFNVYATPTMFVVDKDLRLLGKPAKLGELIKLISE
jgi:thiol-disulfide isomerase/thioredoxin